MASVIKKTFNLITATVSLPYKMVKDGCDMVVHNQYVSPWLPKVVQDYAPPFVAFCTTFVTCLFFYECLFGNLGIGVVAVATQPVGMAATELTARKSLQENILSPSASQDLQNLALNTSASPILEKIVFNATELAIKCFPEKLIDVTKQLVEINVIGVWDIISKMIGGAQINDTCYDNAHYNHYNIFAERALKMAKDLDSSINALSEALLACHPELFSETTKRLVELKQPIIDALTQARATMIDAYEHGGCFDPTTYRAIIVELLPYQIEMLGNLFNTLEQSIHGHEAVL